MRAMRISAFIAVMPPWFAHIAERECNPGNNDQT
jgi:hypothetical protein